MSRKVPDALRPILRFFFSIRGRTGRFFYLLYVLFFLAAYTVFGLWRMRVQGGFAPPAEAYAFIALRGVFIWCSVMVLVRRLHDFGLSGWWWLLVMGVSVFFPGLTALLLALFVFVPGEGRANGYGAPPVSLANLRAAWRLWRLEKIFAGGTMPAAAFNAAREELLPSAAPVYAAWRRSVP